MSTWNYRVISSAENGLGIYEVYYDENGNIKYFSEDAVSPRGDSLEELNEDFVRYKDALQKPVLNYEELVKLFASL